jgi:hypothetical protein
LLVKATQKQLNFLDVKQIWLVSTKMSQQFDSKNLQCKNRPSYYVRQSMIFFLISFILRPLHGPVSFSSQQLEDAPHSWKLFLFVEYPNLQYPKLQLGGR